jgi:hypothetical protein
MALSNNSGRNGRQPHDVRRFGSTNERDYSRNRPGRDLKGHSHQSTRRDGKYRSDHNYRTLTGHDTGYSLGGKRRGRSPLGSGGQRRELILAVVAIVALVVLVLGISSCARGCSKGSDVTSDSAAASGTGNEADSRVSAGASSELTQKFTTALDSSEKLAKIARSAGDYSDKRLPELALLEPDAISFVASQPSASTKASSYDDEVKQGTYPQLLDWDSRWGNVSYAGSVLAVTGSGPTSLSIAYMGLTGKSDKTPADIASASTSAGYATDSDPFTSDDLFSKGTADLGLTCTGYTPSSDNLYSILSEGGSVVVVKLKKDFDSPYEHWAVVTALNDDNSVTLCDPTSKQASSHTWAMGTIAGNSEGFYALSANE